MLIDCDRCVVRGAACSGCVISVLIGPPDEVELADDVRVALAVLSAGGLAPPLRLKVAE